MAENMLGKGLSNVSRCQHDLIPEWIIRAQCVLFAILWTFTMLPHTSFVRNAALILGSIIGIYVVIKKRNALIAKRVIPLAIIGALFVWVTLHLLFIGQNQALQWTEYQSLWKHAFLGALFALGLGLSLAGAKKSYLMFIFVGICGPAMVYYLKFLMKLSSIYFGYSIPEAMVLYTQGDNSFYVPKISYVFYCLPALAIALGYLSKLLKIKDINWILTIICILVIMCVLGIFYLENIKNGFAYAALLTLIFFASLLRGGVNTISLKSYGLLIILGFVIFLAIFSNFSANDSWKSFTADTKVAIRMQPDEAWGKQAFIYPLNEYGNTVSPTNFDRIFYLKTAIVFLGQNPLGYGLVHSSFGHIARESFPNAPLIQSHSGWMDLALGLGIPGATMLFIASIFAMFQISTVRSPWSVFGLWLLLSITMLLMTTEVAQKNFIDSYVWLVVLVASLSFKNNPANSEVATFYKAKDNSKKKGGNEASV